MHGYCPFPPPLYAGKKNFFENTAFTFQKIKKKPPAPCSAEDERRAHRAAAPAEANVQVDELPFQHHAAA